MGHEHRFGGRGRAVIHGGVGDLHAEKIGDLGLELEEDLQRALRDLRLIGRVAGEEFGTLDEVIDARRHVMAIGAGADEEGHRSRGDVVRGHGAEDALDLDLAFSQGQIDQGIEMLVGGHVGEEIVDASDADAGKHRRAVGSRYGADSASALVLRRLAGFRRW